MKAETIKGWHLEEPVCTRESTNPLMSSDGGDYNYYETPILMNGEKVGVLHSSSSEFSMCQLTGRFDSNLVSIITPIGSLCVSEHLCDEGENLTDEAFLKLLSQLS